MDETPAYRSLVEALLTDPSVSEGQMMGMPALKLGSKMFGGFFDGDLVVRVGRDRAADLIAAGRATPFDPSGRDRPMKDWARIAEPADDWQALAEDAKRLLASA